MPLKMNQAHAIKKKLIEDKQSSNAELIEYFVNIVGVSEAMAKQYIAARPAYQHQSFQTEKQK